MGRKRTESSQVEIPAGNVVGIDPHKRTLSAAVVDQRGGILGVSHFRVSGDGHRALVGWVTGFGPVVCWGIEGASGLGRHTTFYLLSQGYDVRDVCPTRTNERARRRRQGKTDALDAERIGREVLADPRLPLALKRAEAGAAPDPILEQLGLWHQERRSLLASRQHLLNESETLLLALPEEIREALPRTKEVRPRLLALATLHVEGDGPTQLRVRLLRERHDSIVELDRREQIAVKELARLVDATGSTLCELPGLSVRSAAELIVEAGDPARFTAGGFARFNGTAPLPASSAEGDDEPVRHRLNRGGNRRVNAVLHRMAVTQLRCEPRAQKIYSEARRNSHTKKEAMRILKRHLSDVVHRRMMRDRRATASVAA
jgi:transposase